MKVHVGTEKSLHWYVRDRILRIDPQLPAGTKDGPFNDELSPRDVGDCLPGSRSWTKVDLPAMTDEYALGALSIDGNDIAEGQAGVKVQMACLRLWRLLRSARSWSRDRRVPARHLLARHWQSPKGITRSWVAQARISAPTGRRVRQ